jgi:hypothetical protein
MPAESRHKKSRTLYKRAGQGLTNSQASKMGLLPVSLDRMTVSASLAGALIGTRNKELSFFTDWITGIPHHGEHLLRERCKHDSCAPIRR